MAGHCAAVVPAGAVGTKHRPAGRAWRGVMWQLVFTDVVAHARKGSGSEGRGDANRAANAAVCGGVVAQASASGASMAERYAAVIPAGVVGASRRRRAVVGEGFLRAAKLAALRLKPIGIWISSVIGNRLIPARDFFLEKKQKRARCSGLPSRFILCRTCRAKPPVWAAFPFASLMRRARHALRVPCGMLEPGSGPAHARNRGSSKVRGDAMRAAKCGGLRGCGGAKRHPAGEHGGAFCGGGFGGRGGGIQAKSLASQGFLSCSYGRLYPT